MPSASHMEFKTYQNTIHVCPHTIKRKTKIKNTILKAPYNCVMNSDFGTILRVQNVLFSQNNQNDNPLQVFIFNDEMEWKNFESQNIGTVQIYKIYLLNSKMCIQRRHHQCIHPHS